jgi:ABC-2 type transport system permease protein
MIGTFALVAFQSFVNRIISRLKRLRNPRYLLGALAGIAYFYFVVFRRNGSLNRARTHEAMAQLGLGNLGMDVVSVCVLVLALLAWAFPRDDGGIELSEAEIAFLFPAPLRLRDILLYKIIRSQPQILVTSVIALFFLNARGWFVGTWAAFTAMQTYATMTALGRARLRVAGMGFLARLGAVLGIASMLAWYGWSIVGPVLKNTVEGHERAMFDLLHQSLTHGFAAILLFLPRLVAGAIFPAGAASLAANVGGLLVLAVVFFLIAARLNVSFQEGSIAAAQKRLTRVSRLQGFRGGRSVAFKRMPVPSLRPTGRIEQAIVWKNIVALLRVSVAWVVVFLAIYFFLIGQAVWMSNPHVTATVGVMLACFGGVFVFVGPSVFANDLRLDFGRMEVLKSYPISGERLIAAEIAAPLVIVAGLELLFMASSAVMLQFAAPGDAKLSFLAGAQFVTISLLIAIPVCAMQLVIRNSIPVLFPAWAGRSKEEPRGIAFTGQRLVILIGNLVVLLVALIPAGLVLIPSLWISIHWFRGHPAAIAIGAMPAVFTLGVEVWLCIKFLGSQFDDLDVSNEFDIVEFA